MQTVRGVIGIIILFLGHELHFLFSAAMAVLIGFDLTPILPSQWPGYYDYIFIGILAVIAAAIPLVNENVGYYFSGFLVGAYFIDAYFVPVMPTTPFLAFLLGGAVGALLLGLLRHWALMTVSSAIGAYYATELFTLSTNARILVTAGLFVIGGLTQVILWRMQKRD